MASRSTARNKIHALFSSFLHDKDDIIREKSSNDSDVTTNPSVLSTMCQPRNIESFFQRIETFSPFTWFMKPLYLSPQHCALYGWENTDIDLLTCISCKATLDGILPTDWDSEIYNTTCRKLKDNIIDGHSKFCPWKDSPCPESFLGLPQKSPSEWKDYFQTACQNLLKVDDDLPILKREAFQDMELTEDILSVLSSNLAEYNKVSYHQDIVDTVCVMALCGWNTCDDMTSTMVVCNACHREAGLWNFLSLKSLTQIKNGSKETCDQSGVMEVRETGDTHDSDKNNDHDHCCNPSDNDIGSMSTENEKAEGEMNTEEAIQDENIVEHEMHEEQCETKTSNKSAVIVDHSCANESDTHKLQSQDSHHANETQQHEMMHDSNILVTDLPINNESPAAVTEHHKESVVKEVAMPENESLDESDSRSPEFGLKEEEKIGRTSPEFPLLHEANDKEIPMEESKDVFIEETLNSADIKQVDPCEKEKTLIGNLDVEETKCSSDKEKEVINEEEGIDDMGECCSDQYQESCGLSELGHYKMFSAGVFSPVHSRQDSLIVEVGDGSLDERLQSLQPDLLEACGESSTDGGSHRSLPDWDTNIDEPNTKRLKTQEVDKVEFNVLTEHRNWCPWVTSVPCIYPNNVEKLIQDLPGWKILLKNLSECYLPSHKPTRNQTPPSHVWKSIRRMFYDCQTSMRRTAAGNKNVVTQKQSCT